MTDQNRAKLGGKVMPEMSYVMPGEVNYDWQATDRVSTDTMRTDQQAIKEGVNDPVLQRLVVTQKQVPDPDANAPAFQPSGFSNLERDMGTGFPRGGAPNRNTEELEAGNLITGAKGSPSEDVTLSQLPSAPEGEE